MNGSEFGDVEYTSGSIAFTPLETLDKGTYTVTVKATDSDGSSPSHNFKLVAENLFAVSSSGTLQLDTTTMIYNTNGDTYKNDAYTMTFTKDNDTGDVTCSVTHTRALDTDTFAESFSGVSSISTEGLNKALTVNAFDNLNISMVNKNDVVEVTRQDAGVVSITVDAPDTSSIHDIIRGLQKGDTLNLGSDFTPDAGEVNTNVPVGSSTDSGLSITRGTLGSDGFIPDEVGASSAGFDYSIAWGEAHEMILDYDSAINLTGVHIEADAATLTLI